MKSYDSFENLPCNLCGSESNKNVFAAKDWLSQEQDEFNLVKCLNCELVYINPRPPKKELYKYYYPEDYYTHKEKEYITLTAKLNAYSKLKNQIKESIRCYFYNENEPFPLSFFCKILIPCYLLLFRKRIITRSRWGLVPEKGKHLDVGCGTGDLLHLIKLDWLIGNKIDSVGIDIDPEAIKNAKLLGLDALVADSEHIPFPDSYFDIITLKHSFEHMPDPEQTLNEIFRIAKPGAKLIIEIPNFSSFGMKILKDKWAGIDAPRHLFHFSPETLKKAVKKAGFIVTDLHKWPGTFKKKLSLKNIDQYWISQGYNHIQRKPRYFLLWNLLTIIDFFYRGGTISIKSYKPNS